MYSMEDLERRIRNQERRGVPNYVYDVRRYGAKGDGATDDSAAIQKAIDAANTAGGGTVYFPAGEYVGNVILKQGVYLVGDHAMTGYGYQGTVHSCVLTANATGAVIDTPVGSTIDCGVIGLDINGLGAGTAAIGIHFRNVSWGAVRKCHIYNCADEGILCDAGQANTFEDILAFNCLLDRSRAARAGVIDVDGSDHYLSRIEVTASLNTEGTKSDANLYCCGVVIRAAACMLNSVIGEISDLGIVLMGATGMNTLTNCRADLNYAHGFYTVSARNMFSSCLALNNSQDTTNTYSGFYNIVTTAVGNIFSCCESVSTVAKVHKYGFEDFTNTGEPNDKSKFIGCDSISAGTAPFYTEPYSGATPVFSHGPVLAADDDTTPSVLNINFLILSAYDSATTITDFDDGLSGQDLYLLGDTDVTIANNANIVTNTGANKTLAQLIYHFKNYNGVWYETE